MILFPVLVFPAQLLCCPLTPELVRFDVELLVSRELSGRLSGLRCFMQTSTSYIKCTSLTSSVTCSLLMNSIITYLVFFLLCRHRLATFLKVEMYQPPCFWLEQHRFLRNRRACRTNTYFGMNIGTPLFLTRIPECLWFSFIFVVIMPFFDIGNLSQL